MDPLSNTLLLKALDASNSPVTITNAQAADNPIIYCNDAFIVLSGYDRDEILGRNCRFLQGDDTDRSKIRELRTAIHDHASTTLTILNYTKAGQAFWNDLHISPVLNDANEVTHFIGFQNDISERLEKERILLLTQKLETEIELADNQDLKISKLYKIRKDFTATAQQQVTMPLRSMSENLATLLADCEECLDEKHTATMKEITETSRQISESLQQLLELAELASQKAIEASPKK
jgi:PAS domain S-box-containing protein